LTKNRLKPGLEGIYVPVITGPHGTWGSMRKTPSAQADGWRGSALQVRFQSRGFRCDCPAQLGDQWAAQKEKLATGLGKGTDVDTGVEPVPEG
jgi:hypothetical protein